MHSKIEQFKAYLDEISQNLDTVKNKALVVEKHERTKEEKAQIQTQFTEAIILGDLNAAKEAIENGASTNRPFKYNSINYFPLQYSAEKNNLPMMDLLINNKAQINRYGNNQNLLFIALCQDNLELFKKFEHQVDLKRFFEQEQRKKQGKEFRHNQLWEYTIWDFIIKNYEIMKANKIITYLLDQHPVEFKHYNIEEPENSQIPHQLKRLYEKIIHGDDETNFETASKLLQKSKITTPTELLNYFIYIHIRSNNIESLKKELLVREQYKIETGTILPTSLGLGRNYSKEQMQDILLDAKKETMLEYLVTLIGKEQCIKMINDDKNFIFKMDFNQFLFFTNYLKIDFAQTKFNENDNPKENPKDKTLLDNNVAHHFLYKMSTKAKQNMKIPSYFIKECPELMEQKNKAGYTPLEFYLHTGATSKYSNVIALNKQIGSASEKMMIEQFIKPKKEKKLVKSKKVNKLL